ncbi:uncharacterized protein V1518DRAFT_422020 [Limtongia smithiae]|uniref:uncharacterized protein n=1 Tax=Limtongia smithiae TaxID=1125753 RepID=UPI0034CF2F4A
MSSTHTSVAWLISCWCCMPRQRKTQKRNSTHCQPAYYADFNFYAEQLRHDSTSLRRADSLESIRLHDDDIEEDSDDSGGIVVTTDERTSLLGTVQQQHERRVCKLLRWPVGKSINRATTYDATTTIPRLPYSNSFSSLLYDSSGNGGSRLQSTPVASSPVQVVDESAYEDDEHEDYGLADAQLVPDSFVVSVPLRPTKSGSTHSEVDDYR